MKVYLCWNRQSGEHAVCASEERAKTWLLESMARTAGWAWWRNEDDVLCFGGDPDDQTSIPAVAEGTITKYDLLF